MKHLLLAVAAALSFHLAAAVEVGGVKFDDKTRVDPANCWSTVPGYARRPSSRSMRWRFTCRRSALTPRSRAGGQGAKRISLSLLRDLSPQQFVEALQEGVTSNHSEAEMAGLKERLKQFSDSMLAAGEPKTGTVVLIDWLPENGTRLTVNGQAKGKDIAGEDFYKALLKIWLGNKPVQDDLKQALLGKTS